MDPDLHIGNENAWDQYIRIDIRDTGCGMSPDVLKQIFDPFFTTKKGGKGTGLGLALTEQIVTSHRGVVNAESTPGVGSVSTCISRHLHPMRKAVPNHLYRIHWILREKIS